MQGGLGQAAPPDVILKSLKDPFQNGLEKMPGSES